MNGLSQLKKAVTMERSKRSVTMPDGTAFVWYQTPLTLKQREIATKRAGKLSEDVLTVACCVFILKATDEAGNKLFQQGELDELKNDIPETVMTEIISEVFRDSISEFDEEGLEVVPDLSPKNCSISSEKTKT